jgi:hypothetical protein
VTSRKISGKVNMKTFEQKLAKIMSASMCEDVGLLSCDAVSLGKKFLPF